MKRKVLKPGAYMQIPLWLLTVSGTKHRFVPKSSRRPLQRLNALVLAKRFDLPHGFSHGAKWAFFPLTKGERARQQARFSQLPTTKGRLSATWEALGHNLPTDVAVRLHLSSSDKGKFWIVMADSSGPFAYMERNVNFGGKVVEHCYMVRNPSRQGAHKGFSDQVLANASAVYPAAGIEAIELTAGLSSGSAIWPRFGFAPADLTQWQALRAIVAKNCKSLPLQIHQEFLNCHGRKLDVAVQHIVADNDPLAIFEIVDLDSGSKVRTTLGLKHDLAGMLLAGGHWRGQLDLQGQGGRRLANFVRLKNLQVPVI